ncbi:MAG: hypothetical protein AB8U25_00230 [Rickettsiales endosymbiont of Dermacentor nuttalli]
MICAEDYYAFRVASAYRYLLDKHFICIRIPIYSLVPENQYNTINNEIHDYCRVNGDIKYQNQYFPVFKKLDMNFIKLLPKVREDNLSISTSKHMT